MKNLHPNDEQSKKAGEAFAHLYNIIRSLRGPNGCPWDLEQTARSLRNSLLEESCEAIEAISTGDAEHSKEELGDLLLIIVLIAYIEEQDSLFSITDIIEGLSGKLIRRHPHVFANAVVHNSADVKVQWEKIKVDTEGRKPSSYKIPRHLPLVSQAYQLQRMASKKGFDWKNYTGAIEKVHEEIEEVEEVLQSMNEQEHNLEEELGDLLFAVINLCRKSAVHPVHALTRANTKFLHRFQYIEKHMKEAQLEMDAQNLEQMEEFWNESKKVPH